MRDDGGVFSEQPFTASVNPRMRTPIHHKASRTTPLGSEQSRRESDLEAQDKTDRPFRFPARNRLYDFMARTFPLNRPDARVRWLTENDVRTELMDGGTGCCWFAYQGDDEPVCGETEYDAIARLVQEKGWELSRDDRREKEIAEAVQSEASDLSAASMR